MRPISGSSRPDLPTICAKKRREGRTAHLGASCVCLDPPPRPLRRRHLHSALQRRIESRSALPHSGPRRLLCRGQPGPSGFRHVPPPGDTEATGLNHPRVRACKRGGKLSNAPKERRAPPNPLGAYRISIYNKDVIKSFRDPDTSALHSGRCPRRWRSIRKQAERKLTMLDAAATLEFLSAPPGNRLEKLLGERAGQWSIRVNDRWRVCFRWEDGNAWDVEILDYH